MPFPPGSSFHEEYSNGTLIWRSEKAFRVEGEGCVWEIPSGTSVPASNMAPKPLSGWCITDDGTEKFPFTLNGRGGKITFQCGLQPSEGSVPSTVNTQSSLEAGPESVQSSTVKEEGSVDQSHELESRGGS